MTKDTEEVAALVEVYRAGWANLDAAALRSIWDPEHETVYCPSELDRPLVGKASVDRYFDRVLSGIRHVHVMAVSDVRIDIIDDIACVFFAFHLEGVGASSEPFTVQGRNTLIAHRKAGGWKGIHYHESLRGPLAG
ncbi:YybH family protein [Saccharopolyspora elongata]|uniref:DUF4440 domain-containing protein n=1 Tax=Saccharopolyspora elongata TaxID=2530387 RepID=A0A4R4YW76_9PSEU|nr:nuclear transport factor 2 family protein [Saccharopolyspora elongata]TDD48784.1 DUF4440 domain-containing protein [Saccharopolyspora elongata]